MFGDEEKKLSPAAGGIAGIKPRLPDSDITMDNLENLNEEETMILLDKWKDQHFPANRFWAFTVYNFAFCGVTMYFTLNFTYYSRKFFKPKAYSIKEIMKYGTIQSTLFLSTYFLGAAIVSGFWHPLDYLTGYAKIQGRVIDNTIKYDPYVQNFLLYDLMKYFGLSQSVLQSAQKEIEAQHQALEENNFYSDETKQELRRAQKDFADLQAFKQKEEEDKIAAKKSQ